MPAAIREIDKQACVFLAVAKVASVGRLKICNGTPVTMGKRLPNIQGTLRFYQELVLLLVHAC